MFNAIFGNFLFSRTTAPVVDQEAGALQTEAATQTSETNSISTQTNPSNELDMHANGQQQTAVISQVPAAGHKKPTEDWVIVDANDEPEKLNRSLRASSLSREAGSTQTDLSVYVPASQHVDQAANTDKSDENLVDMPDTAISSPYDVKTAEEMKVYLAATAVAKQEKKQIDDDSDVMLGSFFERNEREMKMAEEEQVNPVEQENETWLITPLPCLTSITSSQRSIVENGTLENLLIEHPSMSVFMSATSSCSSSPIHEAVEAFESKLDHHKQHKVQGKSRKSYKAALLNQPSSPQSNQHQQQQPHMEEEEKKQPAKEETRVAPVATVNKPVSVAALKELSQPRCVLVKSVAEKRKEANKSANDLANTSGGSSESLSSAATISKRKEKKNKKSLSPVGGKANKENQQREVKTLLLNEFKKCGTVNLNRFDCTLSNKNQMKRNNKNATFTRDANKKQRKYHNLQQPSFSYNISSNNNQY